MQKTTGTRIIDPKSEYQRITTFVGGINKIADPRRLMPNGPKEQIAELQEADNVEITDAGSIVTANGFEAVSNIVSSGGVKKLFNYEKDSTTRYLVIVHDDDVYSITPSTTAWNSEGDYGTAASTIGGTVYNGTSSTRRLIIGNEDNTNSTLKFNGSTLADIGAADPDGAYIFAAFQGRLFAAKGSTLYYTAADDETDWAGGGTIGFNDIITGLEVEGKRLIVFTRTYHQAIIFDFNDSFNISSPLKEPFERNYGALSYKAITRRDSSIRYWGHDNRIYDLGAEVNVDESGLPRPVSISDKIDPSLDFINLAQREKAVAIPYEDREQWWLTIPYNTSQNNSLVFVLNERFNAWTTRSGFNASDLALFRNSDYKQELYFGDALSPTLYKFNDNYDYNGAGYTRKIRTKRFTMGDASIFKEWKWVDIAGSMSLSTELYVTVRVDFEQKTFKITNTSLEQDAFGNYIGDNFRGDALLGGDAPAEGVFKRFRAHIPIPTVIREGFEMEITIFNDGAGQPWKIDELGIEYERHPRKKRLNKFIINQTVVFE